MKVDPARVSLREITADNVRAVVELAVAEGQTGFVASNAISLAQALFAPHAWYRAVCVDDEPVGFVMLADASLRDPAPDAPEIGVWRFMIDARHQSRGIGRAALAQVVEHARRKGFARLELSYVPGPGCPEPFYRGIGLLPTGRVDGDEIVLERPLDPLPPADPWRPTLHAAGGLRLEPVTPAHADGMYPLLAEPSLYRYLDEQRPPASLEALRERYDRLERGAPPEARQRWLNWVVRAEAGEPVGTVQATVIDDDRASWVAYVFGTAHRGRGHATAAVRALLEHLAARGVGRFLAMVDPDNRDSIALLHRLGFAPAGEAEAKAHETCPRDRLFARAAVVATPVPFATVRLPRERTVVAPDGSDVRVLSGLAGGGMAHFALAAGHTAAAVTHRTVEEIWYVLEGRGEIWRRHGAHASITPLEAGVCVTLPLGTHFQFRAAADTALAVVATTMPPWPGPDEAVPVAGPWKAGPPA